VQTVWSRGDNEIEAVHCSDLKLIENGVGRGRSRTVWRPWTPEVYKGSMVNLSAVSR